MKHLLKLKAAYVNKFNAHFIKKSQKKGKHNFGSINNGTIKGIMIIVIDLKITEIKITYLN